MGDRRPWSFAEVTCRNCGLRIPVSAGVVRMGAADLFVCPACNHQAVWRDTGEPVTAPAGSGVL